jgi:hypothetical protein
MVTSGGAPKQRPTTQRTSRLKTIIHVNQHKIKANLKNGTNEPVLTVKTYNSNRYCHNVKILGESTVVYSEDKPLSCGARVWIETQAEVEIIE